MDNNSSRNVRSSLMDSQGRLVLLVSYQPLAAKLVATLTQTLSPVLI